MNSPLIRAFFAIDLPLVIKESIAETIGLLQRTYSPGQIRWVKSEHWHVTLQFIAALKQEEVDPMIAQVSATIKNIKPFSLKLTEIELFPSPEQPRVISFSITPQDELAALAAAIGQGIVACGYAIESRPFSGHLTLGRIKDYRSPFNMEKITAPQLADFLVKEIIFYRSELSREGSNYFRLATIHL